MRLFKFLFLAFACLSFSLAACCFEQVPLFKKSTMGAVELLEKSYIDTIHLSELDKEMVNTALQTIRRNDNAFSRAYTKIWRNSVFGFFSFGLVSLALAWTAHRKSRVAVS